MLRDALGNEIKRGWAIQCDARRGSSDIRQVYVLGVKGKSAIVLGSSWYGTPCKSQEELEEMVAEYDAGNKDVKSYTKTYTRIVMTGEKL